MLYLLLSIVLLGIIVAVFSSSKEKGNPQGREVTESLKEGVGEAVQAIPPKSDCSTCVGTAAAMCEQECMMKAATEPIEYFDDEELDVYRGRSSDAYSDEEAEEFRDVMFTMRPDEVAAWGRSLRLREVNLPDQIKDDFALLVS